MAALLLSISLLAGAICRPNSEKQQREWIMEGAAFGTNYRIKIASPTEIDSEQKRKLKRELEQSLRKTDALMSNWNPKSEVEQINSWHSAKAMPISAEIYILLKEAERIYHLSGGAFDPARKRLYELWRLGQKERAVTDRLPSPEKSAALRALCSFDCLNLYQSSAGHFLQKGRPEIQFDLSAIAKGYGADRICQLLENNGYTSYMVEIGGEICTGRRKPSGQLWQIGIEQPEYGDRRQLYRIVQLEKQAMATSGDYRNYFIYQGRRYSHIIDPRKGSPANKKIASATVIGPQAMTADALATSLLIMTLEQGRQLIESLPQYEALWILDNNNSYWEETSSGMKRWLQTPAETKAGR